MVKTLSKETPATPEATTKFLAEQRKDGAEMLAKKKPGRPKQSEEEKAANRLRREQTKLNNVGAENVTPIEPATAEPVEYPTPEQMNTLLIALQKQEVEVNTTVADDLDQKITVAKKRVGSASGDDLTLAFNELTMLMNERKDQSSEIRKAAFKNLKADKTLPERRFLRFLTSKRTR